MQCAGTGFNFHTTRKRQEKKRGAYDKAAKVTKNVGWGLSRKGADPSGKTYR